MRFKQSGVCSGITVKLCDDVNIKDITVVKVKMLAFGGIERYVTNHAKSGMVLSEAKTTESGVNIATS